MRVLQVDDARLDRSFFGDLFQAHCQPGDVLVQVETIGAAEQVVVEQDFDLVVLDACVPGEKPNTLSLVCRWRAEGKPFKIVGVSNNPDNLPGFMGAGCDGTIAKDDLYAAKNLVEELRRRAGF